MYTKRAYFINMILIVDVFTYTFHCEHYFCSPTRTHIVQQQLLITLDECHW